MTKPEDEMMTPLPHYRGWVKREDYRKLERKVAQLEAFADAIESEHTLLKEAYGELEAEVERLREALDEIDNLEPGCIDMAYEIAHSALQGGDDAE